MPQHTTQAALATLPTPDDRYTAMTIVLPPTLRVFERGWLSANSLLCCDAEGDVARGAPINRPREAGYDGGHPALSYTLIDTGYVTHAEQTVALMRHALAGAPLTRIINTHLHSDHCGGNAALHAEWGCRITIPAREAAAVAAWDEDRLSFRATGQDCARFVHDDVIAPGDTLQLGGYVWQVLAAPGHDPHALLLFAPELRILVSGDALWQNGFGVLFPELDGGGGFAEQRAVLDLIASLDAAVVIPGHGPVFDDVGAALERARSRLAYLEAEPRRNALQALRVLIKFRLLQRQHMPETELLRWMDGASYLHRIRARFFGDAPMAVLMAEGIAGLVKAGAARHVDGVLYDHG